MAPAERFCPEDCAELFRADHPGRLELDEAYQAKGDNTP
jgi:hypothetical protein